MIIAIIGILASLLLPALFRAKSAAHKAVCINNQRQIGIARQLYANDNDGFLILHSLSGRPWGYSLCVGYLGRDTDLFECPSEKRIPRLVAMGEARPGSWGWGYQQNSNGMGRDRSWGISGPSWEGPALRESAVASPSRMIVQADGSSFGMRNGLNSVTGFGPELPFRLGVRPPFSGLFVHPWYRELTVARRHSGQANILFADGHVGSESLHEMLYPSLENWTRFNYDNKQHWRDGEMPSASGWEPPTPWDELVEF